MEITEVTVKAAGGEEAGVGFFPTLCDIVLSFGIYWLVASWLIILRDCFNSRFSTNQM
jgi:hypothetical protein